MDKKIRTHKDFIEWVQNRNETGINQTGITGIIVNPKYLHDLQDRYEKEIAEKESRITELQTLLNSKLVVLTSDRKYWTYHGSRILKKVIADISKRHSDYISFLKNQNKRDIETIEKNIKHSSIIELVRIKYFGLKIKPWWMR